MRQGEILKLPWEKVELERAKLTKDKAKDCKRPRLFVFGMLALQRYINILCKYKIYFKNTDNNNLKINLMKRCYINRRRSNGIESSL